MAKSSIMINLDDPRSDKIADAISNKTSKKILSLLAEKEMSGSEIAQKLKAPLNTVTYNLKNLVDASLIEKSKRMFWSSKGKRMELYKISNKKIIITPRPMIKGVIPTVLITGVIAVGIRMFTTVKTLGSQNRLGTDEMILKATQVASESAALGAGATTVASGSSQTTEVGANAIARSTDAALTAQQTLTNIPDSWTWFLLGALTALLILLIWNWKKNE